MKKIAALVAIIFVFGITTEAEAQILKGFGKRLEKKIEKKIEQKADRHVDKVIDKADRETDKPIDGVIDGKSSKKSKKKKSKSSGQEDIANKGITTNRGQSLSDGLVMMGDNCSDFIWFKEGAMMEFETKDGKGKSIDKSRMDVVSVSNHNGVTVAKILASGDEIDQSIEMDFKCAGDKMYMDFGSLMKQAMEQAGQSGANEAEIKRAMDNTTIDFNDGFMSFPKKMSPGQSLDDVTVSMTTSPTPQTSMEMTTTLTDRKVVSKEKVTVASGVFDCLKISGVRETSIKVMGMNRNMKPETEYMWFAPGIGIIKQENYNAKGKLGSSMELSAYKL